MQCDDATTVVTKASAARASQRTWAVTPVADRAAILRRFGDLLRKDSQELAELMSMEMGKYAPHLGE